MLTSRIFEYAAFLLLVTLLVAWWQTDDPWRYFARLDQLADADARQLTALLNYQVLLPVTTLLLTMAWLLSVAVAALRTQARSG